MIKSFLNYNIAAKMGALGMLGYDNYVKGGESLEYMPELIGTIGIDKYKKMRMNDPIVGGLILHYENLIRSMRWSLEGKNADFVKDQLDNLAFGMETLLYEIASTLTFGFYIGELIWDIEGKSLRLLDIEPRLQTSIERIGDERGNVVQRAEGQELNIPLTKCLHNTFTTYARNPFGISILRHLYKPYYFKISLEATEAIGLDRDLSGLPTIQAPEGFNFTQADTSSPNYSAEVAATLNWAINVVTSIRKDNQQGLVLPYGWNFSIVRGENRTTIPTNDIISRYNTEMAAGMLANFLALGAFASTNNANSKIHVDNFIASCTAIAASIVTSFNPIIKRICWYNGKEDAPVLKLGINNVSGLVDLGKYVSDLISKGVIMPRPDLEHAMLEMASLPLNDDEEGWDEKKPAMNRVFPDKEGGKEDAERDQGQ